MENLDLIIGSSIVVILFAIFIVATVIEFNKTNQNEVKAGKDTTGKTNL